MPPGYVRRIRLDALEGALGALGEAFSNPMTVQVIEGDVVILGPDSVAVALTPAAAEESAHRLLDAAALARGTNQPNCEE